MAVDELTQPLSRPNKALLPFTAFFRSLLAPERLKAAVTLGIGCVVVALFALSRIFGDPMGGEPVAIIAMERSSDSQPASASNLVAERPIESQAPAPAAAPQTQNQVRIFRGSETEPQIVPLPSPNTTAAPDVDPDNQVVIIQDSGSAFASGPLPSVPDPDLIERTEYGLLPKRGPLGKTPFDTYRRPFPVDAYMQRGSSPVVSIMVTGVGLNGRLTDEAIKKLPPDVTLAFAPYGRNLQEWVGRSRDAGHEVFLQVPMEPFDYPDNDPGPHTLLASDGTDKNMPRLSWVMGRLVGYVGVTNHMGARFTATNEVVRPFLLELKRRGLVYLGDGTSPRSTAGEIGDTIALASTDADIVIDATPSPDAVALALERLEVMAHEQGSAIGVISALPVGVNAIEEWSQSLTRRGIRLAPASAVIELREKTAAR